MGLSPTQNLIHMKKYLTALSVFTITAVAVNAQSADSSMSNAGVKQYAWKMHHKDGHAMFMHKDHRMMMTNLNLSVDQKQQVKSLNEEYGNKIKDLEKKESITLKDYRSQKAALQKERKEKFENILTSDQKEKIAKAKELGKEKRKMVAEKRMEKMKSDLSLTDDQITKMQEQRKSMMDQAMAIQQNSSLSDEQKKEQFKDLRKANHDNMSKILTAEQLKKREELRSQHMKNMKNKWENKVS